jgi:hypothetical protein
MMKSRKSDMKRVALKQQWERNYLGKIAHEQIEVIKHIKNYAIESTGEKSDFSLIKLTRYAKV